MSRLSLRARLTLAFTLVMGVVLGLTGLVVYLRYRSDLNSSIDRSLRARGNEVASLVRQTDDGLPGALARVAGGGSDFAQVLDRRGAVIATTPQVRGERLLRAVPAGATGYEHPPVPGLDGRLRLLATPVSGITGRRVVVVGTALGERDDSLRTLAALLAAGGAVALVLASLAGYAVAAGALRPVEAMRRRAASVSASDPGQRLPVPPTRDEIADLGETLNQMLARLEAAFARERAFVADASHELRTPLGILKAELELALRDGRSVAELKAALESAAEETDRLVGLAEDLLVIARLDEGRLALRPATVDGQDMLRTVAARFASHPGREVRAAVQGDVAVWGDRRRLEQALGNLVDNALRHGAGDVELTVTEGAGSTELHVVDSGRGFPPEFIDSAFERFTRADGARSRGGAGLGLAIVDVIAGSHGGRARAANRPQGGADVWLELPQPRETDTSSSVSLPPLTVTSRTLPTPRT